MATSNRLIPVVAIAGLALVGFVLFKNFSGSGAVKPDAPLKEVPRLPGTVGADNDTPEETLRTVIASNNELRDQVTQVLTANKELRGELAAERRRGRGSTVAGSVPDRASDVAEARAAVPTTGTTDAAGAKDTPDGSTASTYGAALDRATRAADAFIGGLPDDEPAAGTASAQTGSTTLGEKIDDWSAARPEGAPGAVSYTVVPPMGYAMVTASAKSSGQASSTGASLTQFVRTTVPTGAYAQAASGPASKAASQAASKKKDDVPYFTVPENATLVGAVAMTSLIGRVPIDDRVSDPMQFKAVVGRDNLAANGFEMPPDIAGMIVTGIAIGDMALSCTQGKVHSVTFVFNDGAIRTISERRRSSGSLSTRDGGITSSNNYLGFISDMHGNPCIPGQFVTNAPRYLTDIVGLATLGVAGQAYADAQRTTWSGRDGSSSSITGNVGSYALGQAVSGATNEVQKWMLQRLKSSFDAVIVPSGKKLVIHLDQELAIDKAREPRRLVARQQQARPHATGAHYGLE